MRRKGHQTGALGTEADTRQRRTDMSFDELLVSSDVISIHTPATAETRHLFNRRTLARMKRSALLVNTARGSIVDEDALVWALTALSFGARAEPRVRGF